MKRKLSLVALLGLAIGALLAACNKQPAAGGNEENAQTNMPSTNAPSGEMPSTNAP
jgi:hypothetical protein